MSARWAASIPLEHAPDASVLRSESDIEVCVDADRLWLRGGRWNETLDQSLRKILGGERFHRSAGDTTARWGESVPSGSMPPGPWQTLKNWLQPVAPATLLSGEIGTRVELRLVRTTIERTPNLLCVAFSAWHDYAISAPQIRLNRLAFAVSDDAQALIRGKPLPPLPGARYAESDAVAVPVGWTWSPALEARVVREALDLADHDIALITLAGVCEVVRSDEFVRATRSAVRLTDKELRRG